MKAFWERLSDREKLFVGAGGAIVAVLALVQLVILPAIGWRGQMSEKRAGAEQLYDLVSEASASAGAVATGPAADLSTPILNVITQSTGDFGVVVNYRNGRPDGGVDANVVADPAKLFEWLKHLETQYGVSVAAADISRSTGGAEAQAQLTLIRRAAG